MKSILWLLLAMISHQSQAEIDLDDCQSQWNTVKPYQSDFNCGNYDDCICGEGYVRDSWHKCEECAPGFGRNRRNHCVRCPNEGELWCPANNQCLCAASYYRPRSLKCTRCPKNSESDGQYGCKCISGYSRNKYDECESCGYMEHRDPYSKSCVCQDDYGRNATGVCEFVGLHKERIYNSTVFDFMSVCKRGYQKNDKGDCVFQSTPFGPLTITFGVIAAGFLGFATGYVVHKYVEKK